MTVYMKYLERNDPSFDIKKAILKDCITEEVKPPQDLTLTLIKSL